MQEALHTYMHTRMQSQAIRLNVFQVSCLIVSNSIILQGHNVIYQHTHVQK